MWESEATPVNIFQSTLPNQSIARESEAPAELTLDEARLEPRPPGKNNTAARLSRYRSLKNRCRLAAQTLL